MKIELESHNVELLEESAYNVGSIENAFQYAKLYIATSNSKPSTLIGIKVYKDSKLINSAIIGGLGGASGIHKTSQVLCEDSLTICCAQSLFKLSIPELNLEWNLEADDAACFEVFKYKEDYIVHGELNISRVSKIGTLLWQRSGKDIFATVDGKDEFQVNENQIIVKDWENNLYKFDFEGNPFPTTEKELRQWMIQECYNFNQYSIGGNIIDEGYGIDKLGLLYTWYYTERGNRENFKYFDSEEEIVEYAFDRIKNDKWAKTHCVGFTTNQEESNTLKTELTKRRVEYMEDRIPYYGEHNPVYRVFVFGCNYLKTEDLKIKHYHLKG